MKKTLFFILFCTHIFPTTAQHQRGRGFPEKNPLHLFENFQTPPKGYGNVPFYWWNGDILDKERLSDQLDILSTAAIDGFAVSYAHTDPRVDKEMAKDGYGSSGNTEPGTPVIFSDEWWDIWAWYAQEVAKHDMGVGLDDYTFAWPKNGYFPDVIAKLPEMKDHQGVLDIEVIEVESGALFEKAISRPLVTAVAWPGKIVLDNDIHDGKLQWSVPAGDRYKVYLIYTKSGHAIHPDHGKKVIEHYFGLFEKKLKDQAIHGLNYFFQDELTYPISMLSWSDEFQKSFIDKKGYDILPYLPALVSNIGPVTPKVRLDYCDVLLDLAERNYFEPIYRWHADRELIYGSDNFGRGKDPLVYVDYFRANSWYTAPGNDAPSRGSSFLETKVSSSIAHLYNRPRTWLEAFHSMGWGSTGAWLTEQIDHHFIAGGNLVCMHGLYYSTHGGWWEWAPPDFHFRMPYWPHLMKWLTYTERMSYILSQGNHVSDIALMYPTESMQAYPGVKPNTTFDLAMQLSEHGLDYDFMHYKPLREAKTENGKLSIGDQSYKILILSDLLACHHSTLLKTIAHYRNGGIVIFVGDLPRATTLEGENAAIISEMLEEMLSKKVGKQGSGGTAIHVQAEELVDTIRQLSTPDFRPFKGKGKVLHRKIGEKDLYMVMNIEKGDTCFFRAKGKVELWDASNGSKVDFPVLKTDENGTYLKMDRESNQSYLIVFSPGTPKLHTPQDELKIVKQIEIADAWDIEYLPTMNNKWGDYRLPAKEEIIGPEAPVFKYRKSNKDDEWYTANFNDSTWQESISGYGIQFESTHAPANIDFDQAVRMVNEKSYSHWHPYEFSWQYGVWDNPGPQGFHGLKSRVSNAFLILNQGAHEFYRTYVWVPADGQYQLIVDGALPDYLTLGKKSIENQVALKLKKGWHALFAGYRSTPKIDYRRSSYDNDPRKRSMVVLVPDSVVVPEKTAMYDTIVSSSWAMTNHLLYSPYATESDTWQFRISTVPGVKQIYIESMGEIHAAWMSGQKIPREFITLLKIENGRRSYKITFHDKQEHIGVLALEIRADTGYQGAAILPTPLKFDCGIGKLDLGNWALQGSLRYYSGGMYYRNSFEIDREYIQSVELQLGEVIATCEVKINGRPAGILMAPPYRLEIADKVIPGKNDIEVLVYSTLANHYQTIPSIYRGKPDAGLIGPAQIIIRDIATSESGKTVSIAKKHDMINTSKNFVAGPTLE